MIAEPADIFIADWLSQGHFCIDIGFSGFSIALITPASFHY
jgi:hypothetical protein